MTWTSNPVINLQLENFRLRAMKSPEVAAYLAEAGLRSFSDIDQRLRVLRRAQKLRSGPRGRHAPDVDTVDVVSHVLGLASEMPRDADDVAKCLSYCRLEPVQPFSDAWEIAQAFDLKPSEITLPMFMALVIEQMEDHDFNFVSFELDSTGACAWVNVRVKGVLSRYLLVSDFCKYCPAEFDRFESGAANSRLVIGARHLREIGRRLAPPVIVDGRTVVFRALAEATSPAALEKLEGERREKKDRADG
ncbi:hypothetical protein HUU61_21615 [Rhodopseudomonas palustris]|nr:hypothetical protein [Rhodopseudomonas palustris]